MLSFIHASRECNGVQAGGNARSPQSVLGLGLDSETMICLWQKGYAAADGPCSWPSSSLDIYRSRRRPRALTHRANDNRAKANRGYLETLQSTLLPSHRGAQSHSGSVAEYWLPISFPSLPLSLPVFLPSPGIKSRVLPTVGRGVSF